jgi:hypothetical protein
MSLTVEYANSPVWANEANTAINLNVKFVEYDTVLPFTATSTDDTTYGPELFAKAVAGDYGSIAAYVKPPVVIHITPTTLAPMLVGGSYVRVLTASGGVGPYTYALKSGSTLPTGLTMSRDAVVGSPVNSGDFTFEITSTDSENNSGTALISLAVYAA